MPDGTKQDALLKEGSDVQLAHHQDLSLHIFIYHFFGPEVSLLQGMMTWGPTCDLENTEQSGR